MKTTEISITCPECGKHVDCHTGLYEEDAVPKDDDLSMCFGCLAFLVFTDNTTNVRLLTDEEYIELPLETRTELQRARVFFNEQKKISSDAAAASSTDESVEHD